jgi:hypothetical protein
MNIENAKYVKNPIDDKVDVIRCTIDSLEVGVPLDPANTDYAEILRQVAAGTLTIADAD